MQFLKIATILKNFIMLQSFYKFIFNCLYIIKTKFHIKNIKLYLLDIFYYIQKRTTYFLCGAKNSLYFQKILKKKNLKEK